MRGTAARLLDYADVSLRRRHICYSGSKPPVLTLTDKAQNTSGGGGTFTGLNLGAAAPDRYMVAAIGNSSATATTAVTIGGVSATQLVAVNSPFGNARTSIWIALVPTGASGNVVISNGAGGNTTIALYSITGLLSPSAVATSTASGTPPQSLSVAVNALGFVICVGYSSGATSTATWSGLTSTDVNVLFITNFLQSAGHFSAPTSTTLSTTFSYSNTNNAMSCCAVSLR